MVLLHVYIDINALFSFSQSSFLSVPITFFFSFTGEVSVEDVLGDWLGHWILIKV